MGIHATSEIGLFDGFLKTSVDSRRRLWNLLIALSERLDTQFVSQRDVEGNDPRRGSGFRVPSTRQGARITVLVTGACRTEPGGDSTRNHTVPARGLEAIFVPNPTTPPIGGRFPHDGARVDRPTDR